MKANELMIGDWVLYIGDDEPKPMYVNAPTELNQVYLLNSKLDVSSWILVGAKYINPIPLTPEILEKNGFEIYEQDFTSNPVYKFGSLDYMEYEEYHKYFNIGCKITYKHFVTDTTYIHSLMRIRYVHELQHALRLCGIEKEIEL